MGDRTSVYLTVLTTQAEQAENLFDYESNEDREYIGTTIFTFYEVNYGELDFLPELADAGIAYDSMWGSGHEYSTGTESVRFTPDGDIVRKTIYSNEVNPNLDRLMELINKPVALCRYILEHKESITVAPIDNTQIEYGKRYLVKKLIAGNI